MTFADTISRDTAAHNPEIQRHDDGSLTFQWKRTRRHMAACLADLTGLDVELFGRRGDLILLHIPQGISEVEY